MSGPRPNDIVSITFGSLEKMLARIKTLEAELEVARAQTTIQAMVPAKTDTKTVPAQEQKELDELVAKLLSDDDAQKYVEARNGTAFDETTNHGYLSIEVLPFLKGLPFNNLALAYIAGLRPSTVRVSQNGFVCCDSRLWRVTVRLDADKKIDHISQEICVGYGCGHDIAITLKHARGGPNPKRGQAVLT